jgi:hypothetical protein
MPPRRKKLTPEGEFQDAIIKRCKDYPDVHVVRLDPGHRSQRGADNAGFPDLMLVGPGGVLYRELKTENGKYRGLRSAQTTWKYRLQAARQDWAIWTPADLDAGRVDDALAALAEYDAEDTKAEIGRIMARP